MKTITLAGGPRTGKTERADDLYREHTVMGMHVLLDDGGRIRNSLPERRMSSADVLIITRLTSGPLAEAIDHTP